MDELIGIALELFIGFICLFILTKFLGRARSLSLPLLILSLLLY